MTRIATHDMVPRTFESVVVIDDQLSDPELVASLSAAIPQAEARIVSSVEAAIGPGMALSKRSLVLLEPGLRGRLGMEVLSRLRTLHPEVPIAVRSANTSPAAIRAALRAGVLGYFPKTMRPALLVAGLQYIAAGGVFVPPETLDGTWEEGQPFPADDRALTAGQTRVLRMLLTGRNNREIGRELNISEGTVKQHLYALYRILGVNSRAEMIAGVARNAIQQYGTPAEDA